MSTKTTLKRIALVAVSALGAGLLSVASIPAAQAGDNLFVHTSDGKIANSDTATVTGGGVAGAANTVKVSATGNASLLTRIVVSGPTAATKIAATDGQGITVAADGLSASIAGNTTEVITISTPEVGTVTVTRFTETAAGSGIYGAATDTVTFTVGATSKSGVLDAASSTSVMSDDGTPTTAGTDDTIYASASTQVSTEVAIIRVKLVDLLGAAYKTGTVAATITGPGLLSVSSAANDEAQALTAVSGSSGTVRVASVATTSGFAAFGVYADGTAGSATINITVDGAAWKSHKVTFYGAVASLVASVTNKQILTSGTGTVTVTAYDALNQRVVGVTPTVSSATTASIASGSCTATTATAGSTCTLTAGATAGSSVVTFTSNVASTAVKTTATVSAAAKPTAVTVAFDKATYTPGEKFTLTLTATNAAGVPGDATYQNLLAGALTPSSSLSAALFAASVALVDGKATATGFMPLASGVLTVSGKTGADATTADVAVTATANVVLTAEAQAAVDAASAAADAAAEAIDAANAATDAANLAAEAADAATVAAEEARDAADAATAAVEELATQVATLMAALKAQITTLANTVAKIAKKVRA